jgi:ferritin-like protein
MRYGRRMSSENLHEPVELLSENTKNLHRAIVSLREELEAVDWYQQRAEACTDAELRAVLLHNKDEEIEHAMMTLEWLRRKDQVFAGNIATYLNAPGPIVGVEAAATGDGGGAAGGNAASVSLGIGSLKGVK